MNVVLNQGELIGIKAKSIPFGKTFYSFLGVPYAESPVNSLRFQAPKPHKGWKGVLEANKSGPACSQKSIYVSPIPFGDEDCLYLNVHVPQSTSQQLKPVMVYVHGGGFLSGNGDFYGPDYLMEYDIIVITFNYRLHVLGFLNLDLPECPGNVGLKDQILLFKWVRDNIACFGGNPNNVTAVGESAGGAAIHYIMLSPLGKGLFDRAIIQSGSAFCPWAFTTKHIEYGFKLGEILGCKTANKRELLNFLLEVPASDLSKAARKLTAQVLKKNIAELVFVPSIERESFSNSQPCFLPASPLTLAKNANYVPLLIGINDLESLIFIADVCDDTLFGVHRNENILPEALKSVGNKSIVMEQIERFYFDDKKPDERSLPAIIDLLTDVYFAYPFEKTYENVLESKNLNDQRNVSVYTYKFSYEGELNLHKKFITSVFSRLDLKGTSHADELSYLFALRTMYQASPTSEDLKIIKIMCTFWSNFTKFGTPSGPDDQIQWIPTTADRPCHLHIDKETRLMEGRINEKRMIFWDNLIQQLTHSNLNHYFQSKI